MTPDNAISFTSYCGGVPKHPNPFRYKFSWSPLGVLKALRSPSRSIRRLFASCGWIVRGTRSPAMTPRCPLRKPSRSTPTATASRSWTNTASNPHWPVREFVRGTLRLNGWADAWSDVFAEVETLKGPAGDARLKEMSDQFWAENAYDRKANPTASSCASACRPNRDGTPVWHKTYVMDAWGDARGTAMARLVSVPVALAVQAAQTKVVPAGVSAAPSDPKLVADWMAEVDLSAPINFGHRRSLRLRASPGDILGKRKPRRAKRA